MSAPDLAEPIAAWRVWKGQEDGSVRSCVVDQDAAWPIDGLTARCWSQPEYQHPYDAGGPIDNLVCTWGGIRNHHCGIHAWKHWRDAASYCVPVSGDVLGLALLGGKVMEHQKGYRATKAKVFAFFCHSFVGHHFKTLRSRHSSAELARRASDYYRVPLIGWGSIWLGRGALLLQYKDAGDPAVWKKMIEGRHDG